GCPRRASCERLRAVPPDSATLWLIPAGLAVVAIRRARGRTDWVHVVLVAVLGVAAMRVSRLDAFFALASVFFFGPVLSSGSEVATANAIPATSDRAWRLTQ